MQASTPLFSSTGSNNNEPGRARRQRLRTRLIAVRDALSAAEHADKSRAIEATLSALLARMMPTVIGFCWPVRSEFDARPLLTAWLLGARERRAALPAVTDLNGLLEFRRWAPDCALAPDLCGIPAPVERITATPDLLLIPLVGFDAAGYRIGYGGGYFDRTLAVMRPRPYAIGVGFEQCRVVDVEPEPHDVRLDAIVTESGVVFETPRREG
ncbi:MAG TPA: 5-formyltetrahydrofolate cyclo-ligase [Rhodocyclaceae bacterium]|nr:5-formyltetrahydrofolate cyclo-ligase [Rhodocyclaceae bacterium]